MQSEYTNGKTGNGWGSVSVKVRGREQGESGGERGNKLNMLESIEEQISDFFVNKKK